MRLPCCSPRIRLRQPWGLIELQIRVLKLGGSLLDLPDLETRLRAFLGSSDSLLLLDEPYSSLDIVNLERLTTFLKEKMLAKFSHVLLVSHNPETIWSLCEELIVLKQFGENFLTFEKFDLRADQGFEQFRTRIFEELTMSMD